MNQKGFTLVEIIAMMVVLGVLMVIAIPNISGIIGNNREGAAVEDVDRMIRNSESVLQSRRDAYPSGEDDCSVLSLSFIDTNNDFKTGMNGGKYVKDQSFVLVKKVYLNTTKAYSYQYYVRYLERTDKKDYIVGLVKYEDFVKNPKDYFVLSEKDTVSIGFTLNSGDSVSKNTLASLAIADDYIDCANDNVPIY